MIIYNLKQHACLTFFHFFCIKALGTATYILFNLNNYLLNTYSKDECKTTFHLGPLARHFSIFSKEPSIVLSSNDGGVSSVNFLRNE